MILFIQQDQLGKAETSEVVGLGKLYYVKFWTPDREWQSDPRTITSEEYEALKPHTVDYQKAAAFMAAHRP